MSEWRGSWRKEIKVSVSFLDGGTRATPTLGTASAQHVFFRQNIIYPEESSAMTLLEG